MKSHRRGFTLIELLVVIAIIGVLSAIVLAFVSSARSSAVDNKIKEQMNSMKHQAELYNGLGIGLTFNSCTTFSSGTLFESSNGGLWKLTQGFPASSVCASVTGLPSAGGQWVVAAPLSSGFWCVDAMGASRSQTTSGVPYVALISGGASPAAITGGSYNCN